MLQKLRIFFFLFIFFLNSGCYAEVIITNIRTIPPSWTKMENPLITWQVDGKVSQYEYIIEKNLNEKPDGEWEKMTNLFPPFIISPPLDSGEYEFWLRAKDEQGNYTSNYLTKIYVDKKGPEAPKSTIKSSKDENIIFWEDCIDFGSGLNFYEASIEEGKIISPVKSGELKIPNTFQGKVKLWGIDKLGNKGEILEISFSQTTISEEKVTPPPTEKEKTLKWTGSWAINHSYTYNNVNTNKPNIMVEGYTTSNNVEQTLNVSVSQIYEGKIKATASVDQIPYQSQKMLFEIQDNKKPDNKIKYGNFSSGFSLGEFISFNKEIEGMEAQFKPQKNILLRVLHSRAKSISRTETFQGANIKGPYKLNAIGIVDGSEVVKIDRGFGEEIQQRGIDYLPIDYFGNLTFTKIIPSNWKIIVSYEFTLDFIQRTGDLIGAESLINFDKRNNLGITYLKETANRGGSLTTSLIVEPTFYGYQNEEDREKEYPLSNWPIADRTEVVKVNNTIKNYHRSTGTLTEDDDYVIDYERGSIRFIKSTKKIPPTNADRIDVSYTYQITFPQKGNIQGVDGQTTYNLPLNIQNPKRVRVYRGNTFLSPKETSLSTVGDYFISSTDNTITFYLTSPPNNNDIFTIEYREVPTYPSRTTSVNREVWDFNYKLKLKQINLESEFAQSISDKESFGTIGNRSFNGDGTKGPYYLDDVANPPINFPNSPNPVVPNSETLLINGVIKTRGIDYFIDYNSGRIIFLEGVNPPTLLDKIDVSYRFFPSVDTIGGSIEKVIGTALKTNFRFTSKKINFGGSFRKIEPTYIPVGAAKPACENQGVSADLSYQINKQISINSNFNESRIPTVDVQTLIPTGEVITNQTYSSGCVLTFVNLPKITLNHQEQKSKDKIQHKVDNMSITKSLNAIYQKKKMSNLSFDYREVSSSSGILNTPITANTFYNIKFQYLYKKNSTFNFDYQENRQKTAPTPQEIRTNAISTGTIWQISDIVITTLDYNSQTVSNSSLPKPYKIDNTSIGLRCNPFSIKKIPLRKNPLPVTSLSSTYSFQSNPSSPPGVDTKSISIYLGFIPLGKSTSPTLSANSSFSQSYSFFKNNTFSGSTNYSISLGWTPPSSMVFSLTGTHSSQTARSLTLGALVVSETNSQTNGIDSALNLKKGLRLSLHADWQTTKNSTQPYSNSYTERFSPSLTYNISDKLSFTTKYQQDKQIGGNINTFRKEFNFSLNLNSPINYGTINISLEYRNLDFSDKKISSRDYVANIFNLKIFTNASETKW